ncbi:MAG: LuxR C-terminal-related transcriptional regulator, partial [Bacteroidota bacterium]
LLAQVQKEVKELAPNESANRSDFNRLNRTIQSNLQSDDDWKQFLSTFEKVHPDFLKQLRQTAQALSPAEQRLACLFRMNLSSKEIATLLNISDEGVKKARYRLRKKLNLSSDVNLQEYLINFRIGALNN